MKWEYKLLALNTFLNHWPGPSVVGEEPRVSRAHDRPRYSLGTQPSNQPQEEEIKPPEEVLQTRLNQLGADGWELVNSFDLHSVFPMVSPSQPYTNKAMLVFKRSISTP
ncbi:MAG: DUF4177 domain-containing protein [Candidatus Cloacimonetes bacterium]|nr:DUF4177 domain-containing protein [Candidatus Cloacimonadota bacterium]